MKDRTIELTVDLSDPSASSFYAAVSKIKKGKRASVLGGLIQMTLAEHGLSYVSGSPEGTASVITALAESYRNGGIVPQPSTQATAPVPVVMEQKKPRKRSEKKSDKQMVNTSPQTSAPITAPSTPSPAPVSTPVVKEKEEDPKQYLGKEQWEQMIYQEAINYFRTVLSPEQAQSYIDGVAAFDPLDKYHDLIEANGIFDFVPLPDENMTFEEWLTKQLNDKNIYKEE